MHFTLEKHRFFPFIAWGLVIGFVIFTYTLTLHLIDTADTLSNHTQATVSTLDGA